MCRNYNPLSGICTYNNEEKSPLRESFDCQQEGVFIRDMNVIPDVYNFYSIDEKAPMDWEPDFSRIQKDTNGNPLFVHTKRGMERAIAAYSELDLSSDPLFGVSRILTYQGQREAIYELGIELAEKEAAKHGVQLIVLEEELDSPGVEEKKRMHMARRKARTPWMANKKPKGWD